MRFLLHLIIIALFISILFIIDLNSGKIAFEIFGYSIKTRLSIFFGMLCLVILCFVILMRLILMIMRMPSNILNNIGGHFKKSDTEILETLLFSIQRHDIKNAKKILNTIRMRISSKLCDYFNAEIAIVSEDIELIQQSLWDLSQYSDTRLYSYTTLAYVAISSKNWSDGIRYCELANNPDLAPMMTYCYMQCGLWQQLYNWAMNSKFLSSTQRKHILSIVCYVEAINLFDEGQYDEAESMLLNAKTDAFHILYLMANIYVKGNKDPKKYIKKMWSIMQCQQVIDFVLQNNIDIKLPKYNNYESHIMISEYHLARSEYDAAYCEIIDALEYENPIQAKILLLRYHALNKNMDAVQELALEINHKHSDHVPIYVLWQIETMSIVIGDYIDETFIINTID